MSIFSERLKWLRAKKNMTQKDVGELLDMSGKSYSKYEYGLREPGLATLRKLPIILGESVDFLIGVIDSTKDIVELRSRVIYFDAVIQTTKLRINLHENTLREHADKKNYRTYSEAKSMLDDERDTLLKNEIYLADMQKKLAALVAEIPMEESDEDQ